jgi:hypothetical protein
MYLPLILASLSVTTSSFAQKQLAPEHEQPDSSGKSPQSKLADEGGLAGSPASCYASNCPTDVNGNATVDVGDLLSIISAWGPCPTPCPGAPCPSDVTPAGGDCTVNVADLLAIITNWGACPPPPNDNCATPGFISYGSSTVAFCTINATTDGPAQPTCGFCCGDPQIHKDVWITLLTNQFAGNYWEELTTCGSPFDTKIAVYRSNGFDPCMCPASGQVLVACNDDIGGGGACGLNSRVRFQLQNLTCYKIRIGGYNGDSGPGVLTSRAYVPGDECFNAIDLGTVTANTSLTVSGDTSDIGGLAWTAGTGVTQAPCVSSNDGVDVWYKFQIGCGGNVIGSVNTCDPITNYDTILTLYRGTCDGLTLVECNDDNTQFAACLLNGLPRKSLVSLPNAASPGYYYVRLSGYHGATGGFRINIGLSCIN